MVSSNQINAVVPVAVAAVINITNPTVSVQVLNTNTTPAAATQPFNVHGDSRRTPAPSPSAGWGKDRPPFPLRNGHRDLLHQCRQERRGAGLDDPDLCDRNGRSGGTGSRWAWSPRLRPPWRTTPSAWISPANPRWSATPAQRREPWRASSRSMPSSRQRSQPARPSRSPSRWAPPPARGAASRA